MKTKNRVEQELDERELEKDLQDKIESDYRAQDKYLSSSRVFNFIVGALIGFILLYFVNRFLLGSLTSKIPLKGDAKNIYVALQVLVIFLCGYMNMKSMGGFLISLKNFLRRFWR